ncbi:dissimilatory adenylylsulfate reductase alpha subunit precursor [Pseudobutyrivibrio sp. UC1225]|uniref:adenylyl-sulfate reductase subunit alpha n=1 Tax=Pseudobutyrivibrio sp. UC1225 TaxID=1798185 RepID=UPI0008F3BF03|nr:adenylyl-sulfate reductase subunit alpha [Pseudobutyrivibrio sp. UC1225]SFN64772.1 dissimilatory adenylylsulfate reductase alpha subunit precursor [Pseudobutyrivibrio sp. UC1225]
MKKLIQVEKLNTDILIIGGGTAGCYAAYTFGQSGKHKVLVAEKANIKRSGCLAAGVNAINAYITEGRVPQDYVDYCKKDAKGIVREDLLLSISENLNEVTHKLEENGLVILKDENGKYVTRGNRNIKINGENIKPILAKMAEAQDNVSIINHINITDLMVKENKVFGAVGFDVNSQKAYVIIAKAVLIATGGAAGLYRPNNPGFSRHKMWYPPFNTGAGYAMGINAGAEMTTFEMRFIALRCKDTIAPTGTIAQGVRAKQMNGKGEIYETKYGVATCERVYGTTEENRLGNGPCYLKTDEISKEQEDELYKAYLNMAPSQTLKWLEGGQGPAKQNVEIEGTEPYIVGGHTASGFWVDNNRATTVKGLYAAGDVAGGAPQKYVTGALVEGKLAALGIEEFLAEGQEAYSDDSWEIIVSQYEKFLNNEEGNITIEQLEESMQKIMDEYAGGISKAYQFNETGLKLAKEKISGLFDVLETLKASDTDELLQIYEIKERLTVCLSLIEHLKARKETRWHSFAENKNYPDEDKDFEVYINSIKEDNQIKIIKRPLVVNDYKPVIFAFDGNKLVDAGGEV